VAKNQFETHTRGGKHNNKRSGDREQCGTNKWGRGQWLTNSRDDGGGRKDPRLLGPKWAKMGEFYRGVQNRKPTAKYENAGVPRV